MKKDPVCGMEVGENGSLKLTTGGNTYFFCSELCLRKFAKERNISGGEIAACLIRPNTPFYKNKTVIVSATLGLLVLSSYAISFLEPFRRILFIYLKTIW